jgi:hypothetical protein
MPLERIQDVLALYAFMFCYIAENGVQCSYAKRIMGWDGNTVWRRSLSLKNNVAANLMNWM